MRRFATNERWRATSASDSSDGADPTVHPVVVATSEAIADVLRERLVGLYVYGSLVTGGFEPDVSDIDLIAVLTGVPDEPLLDRLRAMHELLVARHSDWNDRIEVDYVSSRGLEECRTRATRIARISPGEPLHLLQAGRDYLLDWYPARENARTLIGPPIDTLIPEIPRTEYLEEVCTYLATFPDRVDERASPGSQAYAILTMCRGLYSLRFGEHLSKREAANRARTEFPAWSSLIERALRWREAQWLPQKDGSATATETRTFLMEMTRLLELRPSE